MNWSLLPYKSYIGCLERWMEDLALKTFLFWSTVSYRLYCPEWIDATELWSSGLKDKCFWSCFPLFALQVFLPEGSAALGMDPVSGSSATGSLMSDGSATTTHWFPHAFLKSCQLWCFLFQSCMRAGLCCSNNSVCFIPRFESQSSPIKKFKAIDSEQLMVATTERTHNQLLRWTLSNLCFLFEDRLRWLTGIDCSGRSARCGMLNNTLGLPRSIPAASCFKRGFSPVVWWSDHLLRA